MSSALARHPRMWQRLSCRVAVYFSAVTLVCTGLVGGLIYQQQKQELEMTLGALLLNIARTGALLIDPALHAEVQHMLTQESAAYQRLRHTLAAIQDANRLGTPVYTLTDFVPAARQARFMVTSRGPGMPGEPYALAPEILTPLATAFYLGEPTHTRIYHNEHGTWLTAFAPIRNAQGQIIAVFDVDYRVDVYLMRLEALRQTILQASVTGALVALLAGILLARRVTRSIRALTRGVEAVTAGHPVASLPVQASDEVGILTRAFNDMLAGLRQRDLLRDVFGRYVTPEVAQVLLESPEGLRLGGEKRDVTILVSDLRGYTHLSEHYPPEVMVQVLNAYLARMIAIIQEHGGVINEFLGDGLLVLFGAPLTSLDHAERAAACALAMQLAMAEVNRDNHALGLPDIAMGIGLNSGEVVVGNLGSDTWKKYGVIGNTVNIAARVESKTVGGQILLSPEVYARLADRVDIDETIPVQLKGLDKPLLLRALRGIRGRYTYRLPDTDPAEDSTPPVALWLQCQLIECKASSLKSARGEVVRLGTQHLTVRLNTSLPIRADVRLCLHKDTRGPDGLTLYGKVLHVTSEAETGAFLVCLALTSGQDALALYVAPVPPAT